MPGKSVLKTGLEYNLSALLELGDCPNMEFPTLGGKVFWKELEKKNGLRLQYNYVTGLARILDGENVRKAWGNEAVMQEKFKRLTRNTFLEAGDVIGIARKKAWNIYEHYAVYIGGNQVVHYAGDSRDFNEKIAVRKASMEDFLREDKDYFVLYFGEEYRTLYKIQSATRFRMGDRNLVLHPRLKKEKNFYLYSPEETVQRALSRVGEKDYNLVFNNCEHFALWCKTGVSESFQVRMALQVLTESPFA